MQKAGHQDRIKIAENRVEGFGRIGRFGRLLRANFTGRGAWRDRERRDARAVIGDPIDHLMSEFAKLFRGHIIWPRAMPRSAGEQFAPEKRFCAT
jgi:hypothetical protein